MPAATRTTGLIVAVVLLVAFAGVVTFFVVRTPSGGTPEGTFQGAAPTPDPKLVPADGTPANRAGAGQRYYIQMVDKDDPTVVRAELSAERSRPIEGQTYRVALEKPVIWSFMKDGRTIYARADQGTAYIPDQSKGMGARPSMPQDGVMQGNVIVKVFEAREGNLRPNPDEDTPLVTATTSLVKFDSELGQLEAPERVTVRSEGVEFDCVGVTVIYNEPQQRFDLLHVAHPGTLTLVPEKLQQEQERRERVKKSTPAPSEPALEVASRNGAKPAPAPAPVKKQVIETLYRMVLSDEVAVTQGTRVINAEQLEGWVRLIDNELRPGAVMMSNAGPKPAGAGAAKTAAGTPKPGASGSSAAQPAPATGGAATTAQAQPDSEGGLLTADTSTPVTITCKGPVEVRPLAQKTPELDFNDVFVRFTSKADTGVTFRDTKAKAVAKGNMLEYAATRRDVALAGVGPQGATITLEGAGDAKAERFDMSLVTGVARIDGPGLLTGLGKPGQTDRTMAWKNEGQFQFQKDSKGEVTQVLTKVTASGDTRATDGRSALAGQTLVAALAPINAKQSRLHALTVVGKARAEDGKGGSLDADKLDVSFVPTPGKPEESDPKTVVATGSVKGQKQEGGKTSTLNASRLEAAIGRVEDRSGKPVLTATKVDATETTFTRSDGLKAVAPVLSADPIGGIAHLTGTGNSVSVGNTDSTITGQDMTFYDAERRLIATGPGTLTHDAKEKGEDPAAHLAASWATEMTFDDLQGLTTCKGDALAELTKSRGGVLLERDAMKAEEVTLWLTPASQGSQAPEDRKLLRANITGTLDTRANGKPASIESRLYAAAQANQPPALERLMYLESARITADDSRGTLEVPKPGQLLFLDRRAAEKAVANNAAPDKILDNPDSARGTALFNWTGSMNLDRPKGLVTLRENVRLTHRAMGETQKSQLECETLTAKVREEPANGSAPADPNSFRGELLSADAQGAVWMRYNAREMVADQAHYDAVKRTLHAVALGDNRVQVFGPNAPSSTAKEITWDLVSDRIDITKPGTVTAPRR